MPLTELAARNAKPKEKPYKLTDGQGLYLHVMPSGKKFWRHKYSHPITKQERTITYGAYPDIGIKEARFRAEDSRRQLVERLDPIEQREKAAREALAAKNSTLRACFDEWMEVKSTQVSADYAEDIRRSLELHIFPRHGDTALSDINAPEIIAIIKPLAAKGSHETVRRVCQRLNEIMNFAVNTGKVHANPLSGIKAAFQAPAKEHLPTIKPEELPDFLHALQNASIRANTRQLIWWQLYSMTRPAEAAGTRWDEIDFEKQLWVIPAQRMKKVKHVRDQVIPLTQQMLALLERQKAISGHLEYVFPSDRQPRQSANSQSANAAIKRMGYKDKLVSHGLRSLASTILNEHRFDADLIEAALSHVDKNEVRRAYNRAEYLEPRRQMLQWLHDYFDLQGLPESVRNVVPIKREG